MQYIFLGFSLLWLASVASAADISACGEYAGRAAVAVQTLNEPEGSYITNATSRFIDDVKPENIWHIQIYNIKRNSSAPENAWYQVKLKLKADGTCTVVKLEQL